MTNRESTNDTMSASQRRPITAAIKEPYHSVYEPQPPPISSFLLSSPRKIFGSSPHQHTFRNYLQTAIYSLRLLSDRVA